MVVCKNCGAFMRFEPKRQQLVCDHCGSAVMPRLANTGKEVTENEVLDAPDDADKTYEAVIYGCPQCGGDIMCDDDTAVTFCSYCGASSVVLKKRLEKIQKPKKIIPFKIDKDECAVLYKKAVDKAVFAPSYLKNVAVIEKFRGIYMPYWIYRVRHEGGIYLNATQSRSSGDYTYVDRYSISGYIDADVNGVSYDASSSFSDSMSRAIAPYDSGEAEDFLEGYISGFYADMCNVPEVIYSDNALRLVEDYISACIKEYPRFKGYQVDPAVSSGDGAKAKMESELGYYPVWFLAARDRSGEHISYAVVNGQTGRVAMDMPIDPKKFILGGVLVSIPVIILLNTFLLLNPKLILGMAIMFSVVALGCLNEKFNRLYTRLENFDDEGIAYKNSPRETREKLEKPRTEPQGCRPVQATTLRDVKTGKVSYVSGILIFAVILLRMGDTTFFFLERYTGVTVAFISIVITVLVLHAYIRNNPIKRPERVMYMPWEEKLSIMIKPVSAIVVAIAVFMVNPVHDYWYYGAAIASLLLVLLSFTDLIRGHNKLALRRPLQFNKRGGDA